MTTPKKRASTGFTAKPSEEATEKREIEEFLDAMAVETFAELEKQEGMEEEPKEKIAQELTPFPAPDPSPVSQPTIAPRPPAKPIEVKKPKQHPRNTPRFTRTVK